jgi:hypothetical protein
MSEPQYSELDWRRFLASLGEDPDRAGLVETPSRVATACKHGAAGYAQDPAECLKVFEDEAQEYNELIVVRGIPVYNHCEHHLAPFFGKAPVASCATVMPLWRRWIAASSQATQAMYGSLNPLRRIIRGGPCHTTYQAPA